MGYNVITSDVNGYHNIIDRKALVYRASDNSNREEARNGIQGTRIHQRGDGRPAGQLNDNISGRKSTAKTKKRTTARKKAAGKKPAAKKGK